MHAFGRVLDPFALAASRSSCLLVWSTHSLTMMPHGSRCVSGLTPSSPLISDLNTSLLFRERETPPLCTDHNTEESCPLASLLVSGLTHAETLSHQDNIEIRNQVMHHLDTFVSDALMMILTTKQLCLISCLLTNSVFITQLNIMHQICADIGLCLRLCQCTMHNISVI